MVHPDDIRTVLLFVMEERSLDEGVEIARARDPSLSKAAREVEYLVEEGVIDLADDDIEVHMGKLWHTGEPDAYDYKERGLPPPKELEEFESNLGDRSPVATEYDDDPMSFEESLAFWDEVGRGEAGRPAAGEGDEVDACAERGTCAESGTSAEAVANEGTGECEERVEGEEGEHGDESGRSRGDAPRRVSPLPSRRSRATASLGLASAAGLEAARREFKPSGGRRTCAASVVNRPKVVAWSGRAATD